MNFGELIKRARENTLDEEGKTIAIRLFAVLFILAVVQVYALQQTHIEMCYELCRVQLKTPIEISAYSCTCAMISNGTAPIQNWSLVTPIPSPSIAGYVLK